MSGKKFELVFSPFINSATSLLKTIIFAGVLLKKMYLLFVLCFFAAEINYCHNIHLGFTFWVLIGDDAGGKSRRAKRFRK